MHLQLRFTIPWNSDLSKNKKFGSGRKKFLNPKYRDAKTGVFCALLSAMNKIGITRLPYTKTLIKIYCAKPNNRSDCINVSESICDAIKGKHGIGPDDNLFALEVDYIIDKTDPHIDIEIWSTTLNDMSICPECLNLKDPNQKCNCGCKRNRVIG